MSARDPNAGPANPPAEVPGERCETLSWPAAPDHPVSPSGADPAATRPSANPAAPDHPVSPSGADPVATRPSANPAAPVSGSGPPTVSGLPPVSTRRYELGEEIARGGMGAVYRATDTAFAREVAIKVLHDKFGAGSGAARRFADEARITGQLQHPAIPPVHDLGTLSDGRPFLAMKLIKGDTLADLLRARPPVRAGEPPTGSPEPPAVRAGEPPTGSPEPPAVRAGEPPTGSPEPPAVRAGEPPTGSPEPPAVRAGEPPTGSPEPPPVSADHGRFVAVFERVCQAVAYAHAHQVIHRDLKPANVMVGSYGEVQVMDWGLAKVLGAAEVVDESTETEPITAIHSLRESESTFTHAGSVLGTPAFMPPEQALGAVSKIDARSDVFGLGAILAVILTGKPPFAGNSVETTRIHAAQGNVEECFARLDASGAEPELVSLCKRCLSKKPEDRPADAGEVARAVAELRAGADERVRRAEWDRAAAEAKAAEELNTRREAEARAEAERAKAGAERANAEEQRKRRRVQLALVGVVLAALVGGGIAAHLVSEQRADDQLATEKKRSEERVAAEQKLADERVAAEKTLTDERFAAEQKRQSELRAVEVEAKQKDRQSRAAALTVALVTADTAVVPRLIDDLKEFHDLTGPKLRELAGQPVNTKPGLHARCALLADEPRTGRPTGWAKQLAAYLPECKPDELLTVVRFLKPHADTVAPGLWEVLTDANAEVGTRVRAACALAGLTPEDSQWISVAPAVVDAVARANPVEFVVWSAALEPVRDALLPALVRRYPESRDRIEAGKLGGSALVAEVAGFDHVANLLTRYAADRPPELAEFALTADPRHYKEFAGALGANRAAVVPVLKRELAKKPNAGASDAALAERAKRQGYAAAVLVALGEGESLWPLFAFPEDGDPSVRSHLLERLAATGADPVGLVRRFGAEPDRSAKRALLIALGDFPASTVPAGEREPFVSRLLVLYRDDPDAGLHGAIDWLLRQKWGKGKDVAAIDAELAGAMRGQVAARALATLAVPVSVALPGVVAPQLPAPRVAVGKDWFVNGEGQTFAVVRGPVEFTMGSPLSEPGRVEENETEAPHRKRIRRTFAIATKEVTMAEFLRCPMGHAGEKRYSEGPDTPAVAMSWYQAAGYCNWLSWHEGITREQWCYAPNRAGEYAEGMTIRAGHLGLTGYRLPTEAEWEYSCRSGSVTARYFGRGERLLPRYGWFFKNSDERAWPVGQLRPNELGLFDTLGNAVEWVEDPSLGYVPGQIEEIDNRQPIIIDERMMIIIRGGAFSHRPVDLRAASRFFNRPGGRIISNGVRPTRTLP